MPSSVTSYTDATLRDNTSYVYQVQAVGAPRVINVISGAAPPGANQQGGTIPNPVLAKSNSVSITTLPLLPPRSVTAAVNPINPVSFHVSWAPAPNAQTYNVVRNGQLLGRFTGAFTDTPPRTGWYTYAVATVASEPGGDGVSALSVPVTIHNGPFTVVAFGDSIVWGQGIADAHKFTTLVKNSVSASLAYEAKLSSFARSGAHLVPRPVDPVPAAQQLEIASASSLMNSLVNLQPLGEVPNAYPTIYYQSMFMAPQVVDPANVDLIIMDGCANDISVETVLDPTSQDPDLLQAANQHCGSEMTAILQAVHAKYSRAKIVVTGYYAIVSNLSDLTFLNAFANAVGVPAGDCRCNGRNLGATGGDPDGSGDRHRDRRNRRRHHRRGRAWTIPLHRGRSLEYVCDAINPAARKCSGNAQCCRWAQCRAIRPAAIPRCQRLCLTADLVMDHSFGCLSAKG